MKTERSDSEAYQRILKTARELFYRFGYRATGINEIIEKSGVAKATFYAHFPSKEALAFAYVKSMNEIEIGLLEDGLRSFSGPYEKLLGIIEFLIPWSEERDHRGCAYINVSAEVLDPASPVRRESMSHYQSVRRIAGNLLKELKAERGRSWKDRDPEKLTDHFLLIFTGALALAQIYHDSRPYRDALEALKRLLA